MQKAKDRRSVVEEGHFPGEVSLRARESKTNIMMWPVAVVQEVQPNERGSEIGGAAFCW